MVGRILAIDYGRARIGLALSDPLGITAQPLKVIDVKKTADAVAHIASLAGEHDVFRIVIGLPLNMDGTEGAMVDEMRAFGEKIEVSTGLPLVEWDERLTSSQALSALGKQEKDWKKRKRKLDAVAAQILLQSYLDANMV